MLYNLRRKCGELASTYIYERPDWPRFRIDQNRLATELASVRHLQGRLIGRMEALGFKVRTEASLQNLTEDILKSNEIEGEFLDRSEVRSSIARRLGIDIAGLTPADRNVEGVVEMMLDATQHYDRSLTKERLFAWYAALFQIGNHPTNQLAVAGWRADARGPMQVVSGPVGRERIHYQAPNAANVDAEMGRFLGWFNGTEDADPVLKAAVAHLWFVTIHPFDDGNGRIARALTDLLLARSEQSAQRFYSMSAQIRNERADYYRVLEQTQKGDLDITPWIGWFLSCLAKAFERAEAETAAAFGRARFWARHEAAALNERQRSMLNKLIDGFEGKLTSSKWAKIAKCSPDTALRDIDGLIAQGILKREHAGGRSTSYALAKD
jgi:Fic family protein